jgi:hypothetical protein
MGRGRKGWLAGSRRRPESRPLRRERHRRWRLVAQRRVRPPGVVLHSPLLDHDLCLSERVKNLPVQAFISQLPVEAFAVSVLPRTSGFDVQRSCPHFPQPLPQIFRNELRAIVRTNVFRGSPEQHHIRQRFNHLIAAQSSRHSNRQALPRVFVDHRQHADRSSIVRHGAYEIVAPHVIRPLGPQPHTRSVIEPESSPRLLFLGYLQPFATPDALHSIFSHLPACCPQQRRDPAVAVAAILTGQGNDRSRQRIFIHSLDRHVALGSTPLLHQSASMSFREFVLLPRMPHRTATSLRA